MRCAPSWSRFRSGLRVDPARRAARVGALAASGLAEFAGEAGVGEAAPFFGRRREAIHREMEAIGALVGEFG